MVRRVTAPSLVMALVAAWLALVATPAHAACHIAGFVEGEVEGSESTGVVSLTVELQGRVGSCAGTVDVATVDGTAVAGEDYEAVTQTLTYEENDDRVETVDVTILADDVGDGGETFTLELSNPTGDISGTGDPATVTITDDGGGDATDDGGEAEGTAAEETAAEETAAEDAATDEETAATDDAADEGGGSLGIIIAVLVALGVAIGAFAVLRGRDG